MQTCFQFKGVDVLEHGRMVTRAYAQIIDSLKSGIVPEGWRIPKWLMENAEKFVKAQFAPEVIYAYQLYHDCGKPRCRTVDGDGRQHFPDHAAQSERTWLAAGGDALVGRLMGLDMAMHLASAVEMAELIHIPEAPTLYLTALAEVHANAEMFGGYQSGGFLSKAKHLDRRGKQLLSVLS